MPSYFDYAKNLVEIFLGVSEFNDCQLIFRLHPKSQHRYTHVVEIIEHVSNPRISLDTRDVHESLEQSDVVIGCSTSYGFDALRAGCEVITVEARAFYANPLYSFSPMNREELEQAMWMAIRNV